MQKVKGAKVTRKVKIVKRKFCIKKDTHVYNNCYEIRSRAVKHVYVDTYVGNFHFQPLCRFLAFKIKVFLKVSKLKNPIVSYMSNQGKHDSKEKRVSTFCLKNVNSNTFKKLDFSFIAFPVTAPYLQNFGPIMV